MTYVSVMTQVISLLQAGVSGMTTVASKQTIMPKYTPDVCPLIALKYRPSGTTRISGTVTGPAIRKWYLDTELTMYGTLADDSDFEAAVESIEAVLCGNPFLGGLADTASGKVFLFGVGPPNAVKRGETYLSYQTPASVRRSTTISALVQEEER